MQNLEPEILKIVEHEGKNSTNNDRSTRHDQRYKLTKA